MHLDNSALSQARAKKMSGRLNRLISGFLVTEECSVYDHGIPWLFETQPVTLPFSLAPSFSAVCKCIVVLSRNSNTDSCYHIVSCGHDSNQCLLALFKTFHRSWGWDSMLYHLFDSMKIWYEISLCEDAQIEVVCLSGAWRGPEGTCV